MRTEPEIRRPPAIDLPDGGRPNARRTSITLIAVVGAVAVAIGAGVWQTTELAERNRDIATVTTERDAAIADATASAERVSTLEARVERLEARLEVTAGDQRHLAARLDRALAELEALAGPPLPDGRHFGHLAAVGATQQPPRLVIDIARWFTDQAAIDAAIEDGVTPWDYDAPESGPFSRSQVDTSACAIAASGLLDLAGVASDGVKARAYRDFALTSLRTLSEKYLGSLTPGFEGILNGGVYHIHKNLGVHEAVMFGEYFFVEALDKALKTLRRRATPQLVKPYPEDSLPSWARQWQDGPTEEDLPAPETAH